MIADRLTLYTIGHSNHEMEDFLRLLDEYEIDVIVDVRSAPYSRWVPQFGRESLERSISESGREYAYLGRELGGRPEPKGHPDLYDEQGRVRYDRLAELESFQAGIRVLRDLMRERRVAIMCSEEDPAGCHRRLLIGRVLTQAGDVELHHIRRDGGEEVEPEVRLPGEDDPHQVSLFAADEKERRPLWRSTRSVLDERQQENSSRS